MITKTNELKEKIIEYLFLNLGKDGKEKITEERIASYFKVSRTPVREVLKSLEQDGLINVGRNRGIKIRKFTEEDIKKIYHLRIVLEELAIREAVENIKPEDIKELKAYARKYKNAREKKDRLQGEKYDTLFHEKIVDISKNWYLKYIVKKLRMFSFFFSLSKGKKRIITKRDLNPISHNKIIKALITKDPDFASETIKNHILWSLNYILKKPKERR